MSAETLQSLLASHQIQRFKENFSLEIYFFKKKIFFNKEFTAAKNFELMRLLAGDLLRVLNFWPVVYSVVCVHNPSLIFLSQYNKTSTFVCWVSQRETIISRTVRAISSSESNSGPVNIEEVGAYLFGETEKSV